MEQLPEIVNVHVDKEREIRNQGDVIFLVRSRGKNRYVADACAPVPASIMHS